MRLLIAHQSSTARATIIDAMSRDGDGHGPPEIIEAEDGQGALDVLLSDDAPGFAVVDWDLPGIEGPELCRLVRDFHFSSPPYIVVLAGSGHQDTRDAYQAGAEDCVSTPASPTTVRASMKAGLRVARARRASDEREERSSVRASLESVRMRDTDSVGFFGFTSAGRTLDPAARRAVLEAMVHPS